MTTSNNDKSYLDEQKRDYGVVGGCVVLIIIVVIIIVFVSLGNKNSSDPQNSTTYSFEKYSIGKEGILNTGGGSWKFATSYNNFEKETKAIIARDDFGLQDMVLNGEVFTVQDGTKLKILDYRSGAIEARILDGEKIGQKGWIVQEVFKEN